MKVKDTEQSENTKSRRNLVKGIFAVGGTVTLANTTSSEWVKPVVKGVVLPGHAATSPTAPTGGGANSITNLSSKANGPSGPLDLSFDFSNFPQFTSMSYVVEGPNSSTQFAAGSILRSGGTVNGSSFSASTETIFWVPGNFKVRVRASGPATASRNSFSLIRTAHAQSVESSETYTYTDADTDS
ncbi:MAG: hypothetical protein AAF402_08900 [Pseudomonadota bacterium]